MAQIIDDILNLSRITRHELRCEQVNLSDYVMDILTSLREADPKRAVECIIAPGITVTGDAHLLRIALENLIGNACKYTARTEHATIDFGFLPRTDHDADDRGNRLACFVRDNGAGFDLTYAHKLFDAFQRLHAERDFPGSGIGLATVQRIISRHAGRLWDEGAVGHGATFYFTLDHMEVLPCGARCHDTRTGTA